MAQIAMLAVGLYEAWLNKRGPLGWIVNIIAAVIGGLLVAGVGSLVMEMTLSLLRFEGSLAASKHQAARTAQGDQELPPLS